MLHPTQNTDPTPTEAVPPARRVASLLARVAVLVSLTFLLGAATDLSARRSTPETPSGFWWGCAHGALMPTTLPSLLLGKDAIIYAPYNTGRKYKIGYTVGVNGCGALFFGLLFRRLSARRSSAA